jgi:predicted transposase/invertase (TIGR01784 family)
MAEKNKHNDSLLDGMLTGRERYINPYTDFGFKKLFGTEMNKDLLMSFLNALLAEGKNTITEIQYLNSENLGDGYTDRRSVFDVYCKADDGSRFIVEMQKAEQAYFKDRSVYYATTPIRQQAPKGKWNYHLENVYTVGILNFEFPDNEYPANSYRHEIKLKDVEDNHVFYDKLSFVYLEMPKFNKSEDELETMFDKWMFVLRNLSRLLERPKALQDRIFKKLFQQAEIAQYNENERRQYESSLKEYWDYTSTLDTAYMKGERKGREEGREEGQKKEKADTVRRLKQMGLTIEQIAQGAGLSTDEVASLLS